MAATSPRTPQKPPTAKQEALKADKPKRERKPLPEIPLDDVTTGRLAPEEMRKLRPVKQGARNETQRRIDENVKSAYQEWKSKGAEHTDWAKMPGWTIHVPKQHEEVMKAYIRKAGLFHGVQIRFGRTVALPEGKVAIVFVAKDPKPKNKSGENEGEESEK